MKGSIIIFIFFVAGVACGVSGILPTSVSEGKASTYALWALLFVAGISVGSDSEMVHKFLSIDPKILLLPFASIAGTLAACLIAGLVIPSRTAAECMAVGSGMSYYSLSSIMVTGLKGPELGAVTLIANVLRELATMLGAPLMVRFFGPLAPIAAGGANTMDTTLPMIMRYSGESFAVPAIYNGLVVTFIVPFIVTFFCSL